jgi:CRISPR-associated protein Cas2
MDYVNWLLYDISDDRARTKVSKLCKKQGLYRVQHSVFVGTLAATERDELQLTIVDLIDEDHDKVYLFTISRKALHASILLGQAFDRKLVTDELVQLFL